MPYRLTAAATAHGHGTTIDGVGRCARKLTGAARSMAGLKTTISHPNERAAHAQKMAMLNVFPKRLRESTKESAISACNL